jgi:predicted phosphodiesterase
MHFWNLNNLILSHGGYTIQRDLRQTHSKHYNSTSFREGHHQNDNRQRNRQGQYIPIKLKQKNGKINKSELADAIRLVENSGYFCTKEPLKRDYVFDLGIDQGGEPYQIGLVSDTHLCSRYQQLENLHKFYSLCEDQGIETVIHAGDICDGIGVYKGHEYEVFKTGADEICNYVCKNYPEYPNISTNLLCGNHDESIYKRAGMDIGKAISSRRKDIIHRGFYAATFLVDGIRIAVHHGRGNGAYARSYKSQKLAEALVSDNPENNPDIAVLGHFHCSNVLPGYMGMMMIQMPAFQGQTPLGKTMGRYPDIAGIIIEILPRDTPRFIYSSYKEVKEDY